MGVFTAIHIVEGQRSRLAIIPLRRSETSGIKVARILRRRRVGESNSTQGGSNKFLAKRGAQSQ